MVVGDSVKDLFVMFEMPNRICMPHECEDLNSEHLFGRCLITWKQ